MQRRCWCVAEEVNSTTQDTVITILPHLHELHKNPFVFHLACVCENLLHLKPKGKTKVLLIGYVILVNETSKWKDILVNFQSNQDLYLKYQQIAQFAKHYN